MGSYRREVVMKRTVAPLTVLCAADEKKRELIFYAWLKSRLLFPLPLPGKVCEVVRRCSKGRGTARRRETAG